MINRDFINTSKLLIKHNGDCSELHYIDCEKMCPISMTNCKRFGLLPCGSLSDKGKEKQFKKFLDIYDNKINKLKKFIK